MKVADTLGLMQRTPQAFKLADDIMSTRPKKKKPRFEAGEAPLSASFPHMQGFTGTGAFQGPVAEKVHILSTGWFNRLVSTA